MIEDYEEVEVKAYSGYRAEESPREFCLDGKRFIVQKILERSSRHDVIKKGTTRVFMVLTGDGKKYELLYDEEKKHWFVRKPYHA